MALFMGFADPAPVARIQQAPARFASRIRFKNNDFDRVCAQNLSPEILSRAAILYIQVSFAESLRKNRLRYNPQRPDSILEHGLTDEKMEQLYKELDWAELSQGKLDGSLDIQGYTVPFVVFENEDDLTTPAGEPLGARLEERLNLLWQAYQKLHA
jgi:hypothetical protein